MWEIDEFLDENAGLIVAEIELPDEDAPFERPDWLGREVSNDPRYFNSNLVRHPFPNGRFKKRSNRFESGWPRHLSSPESVRAQ